MYFLIISSQCDQWNKNKRKETKPHEFDWMIILSRKWAKFIYKYLYMESWRKTFSYINLSDSQTEELYKSYIKTYNGLKRRSNQLNQQMRGI